MTNDAFWAERTDENSNNDKTTRKFLILTSGKLFQQTSVHYSVNIKNGKGGCKKLTG